LIQRPPLRERLRSEERLIGTVLSLPGVALAELAAAPWDLVWIDLEHGALGVGDAQELAIGVQSTGCAALVRLPRADSERLFAILDAGVDGVVLPGVESAAEVEATTARLRYPPAGARGYGPRRAGGFGRTPRFWASAQADVACVVQVESPAGVAAAGEIAAAPGVDAVVVGCADLSVALGVPQDLTAPELAGAVEAVGRAAAEAGVAFGVAGAGDVGALAELAGPRARLVVYSADVRLYAHAVDAAARALGEAFVTADPHVDQGVSHG